MLRSLYNISIGRRVFLAFMLTTVIALVAMSLLSTYYFNALLARDQAVKTAFAAQHTANDQLVNLQRMNALLRTRLAQVFATTAGGPIQQDPSLEASGGLISIDLLTREITFEQTLTLYQQKYALSSADDMSAVRTIVLSDDPNSGIAADQQAALTEVAKSEWPRYKVLQDQVLFLLDPATNSTLLTNPYTAYEQAYNILFQANDLFLSLTNNWQQVVNSAQNIGEIVTNVGPSQYQPILISTTIALLCTIFVIIIIGYAVNLTIIRPLRHLVELTQRIAKGENEVRARVRGRDEIALVAASMNNMLDSIVQLVEQSESQRTILQLQVEQLVHQVSGVGQGDLRAHAEVTLPELAVLATSFNFMVEQFSSLIRHVKSVAYEVVSSTTQMSQSTKQLVKSAGQQITQIRDASGEVERMALASGRVAQRAGEVSQVAVQARESAQQGTLAVRQTVAGISKINSLMRETAQQASNLQQYSSSMNEISNIVSNLAQRTQRLSLDAAIQASLAGAANTGFSEIVKEIRNLADQAKKETERISGIARTVIQEITALQRATLITVSETESISQLTTQTGQALEKTFLAVQRQADEIQGIAKVAEAQVQSSQRVVEVMRLISQATQGSSIVTQDIATQVQGQGQLIFRLRTSVEAFRVEDAQRKVLQYERYAVPSGKLHE